ncbi:MAG TPA: hypothetical protein VLG50_05690 [Candidatus Saccharimonadales bacterium]|nr:hypothetical protein [Candidatus Saccharimonadales bacterium]
MNDCWALIYHYAIVDYDCPIDIIMFVNQFSYNLLKQRQFWINISHLFNLYYYNTVKDCINLYKRSCTVYLEIESDMNYLKEGWRHWVYDILIKQPNILYTSNVKINHLIDFHCRQCTKFKYLNIVMFIKHDQGNIELGSDGNIIHDMVDLDYYNECIVVNNKIKISLDELKWFMIQITLNGAIIDVL